MVEDVIEGVEHPVREPLVAHEKPETGTSGAQKGAQRPRYTVYGAGRQVNVSAPLNP